MYHAEIKRIVTAVAFWLISLCAPGLAAADNGAGAPVACDGALKQGGLIVCHAPAGSEVQIGDMRRTAPASGVVTYGLRRNAPEALNVSAVTPDGHSADLALAIIPRMDPVRRIEGLDCDKVDARTKEQKAHASASWVKKVKAFARFDAAEPQFGAFIRPAEGKTSSPFGPARTYVGISAETGEPCDKTSVHRGYDIAAPIGTAIIAPAAGTVVLAEDDLYYEGGTVFLDHGAGLVSVFMHMSEVDVSVGDSVQTSDRLGAVGNTGRTTGPHLHWAVKWRDETRESRDQDRYIDPALLLDMSPAVWSSAPTPAGPS